MKPGMQLFLLLLAATAGCAAGRQGVQAYQPPTTLYYAREAAIQALPLTPPPADGSEADRRDLAELIRLQEERTPAGCERALKEAASGYENFFGDIGPFRLPLEPAPAALLRRVRADVARAVYVFKKRFARKRPYLRDGAVKPCLKPEAGYAYPSGHSALAMTWALVLADLRPDLRAPLLERARGVSLGRALGGVHHPADIEAGRELGYALHAEIAVAPAYAADLAAVAGYAAAGGAE
ncbi:MAG TPA: hypothetical protein DEQ38_10395 [Elusimicrobia bacterium]|nr:MAG: hypothetical protein A2089_11845 [Elusimicrobia bacterium GWD2_63_28]HCC48505.1 hypothetical protein [Elusimicrobiota bacterium]